MSDDAILKNQKSRYLSNFLTDRHKIWQSEVHWPSNHISS